MNATILFVVVSREKLLPTSSSQRRYCNCPSPSVPNLLSNEDELTIQVCLDDHSWSFLVILAMTMTINWKSVLLVHVASAGRYESFEHVQKVCIPSSAQHEYFSFMVMSIENV